MFSERQKNALSELVPVTLTLAGTTAEVTVSAEAELIETQRTSATTTIGQTRIDNLPINGRNYINFTLTNSQVARDTAPSIGAAPTSGLNIGGQRARSNLVNVDVLVTTDNGQPIPGLKQENFKVLDDGVAQSVTNFGISKAPMTVAMVIEYRKLYWQFLYLALQDSYEFLNYMQPQDWVAAIYFDMNTHILTDFTHDRTEVRAALGQLNYPEFSENNLYDAVAFIDAAGRIGRLHTRFGA